MVAQSIKIFATGIDNYRMNIIGKNSTIFLKCYESTFICVAYVFTTNKGYRY